MSAMASEITNLTIIYSSLDSGADQRKHQSSASLAFVRGIHWWLVNYPHKGPVNAENVSIRWRHHGRSEKRTQAAHTAALTSYHHNTISKERVLWFHSYRRKMAVIFQTTFSNAFSWIKMSLFGLKFNLNLFLREQLTINQLWFRQWLAAG